jgi:hypothetical protein
MSFFADRRNQGCYTALETEVRFDHGLAILRQKKYRKASSPKNYRHLKNI